MYRYSISLRMTHPRSDLVGLAKALELTPSRSWKVGEARRTRDGEPLEGAYPQSYWTANLMTGASEEKSLEAAMSAVVARLSSASEVLLDHSRSGGRAELFIGWFFEQGAGGDVLTHKILGQLAALRLDLSFDLYGAVGEG